MTAAWNKPDDLRERMLACTVRGTNLDPDHVRGDTTNLGRSTIRPPETIEQRRAKAKLAARARRARRRQARLKESA